MVEGQLAKGVWPTSEQNGEEGLVLFPGLVINGTSAKAGRLN